MGGTALECARSDEVEALLRAPGKPHERRTTFLSKLLRPECQRQWARVLAASSGWTAVPDVPHVLPSQPFQRFFMKFPGLTGFIGRIMLSYFDNTTTLEQVSKRQRQSSEDEESNSEC